MASIGDTSATFCATLVDEFIRQGIEHAVVAPGSRSTPLAIAIANRAELSLHIFHDERSASFAALGIGLSSGKPAILLCTSGTAATHFHGAVVEAHQANVPMIVCTADRPPELRDVGAPQTINQTQLFGSSVRWFHDPGVPSRDAAHTWRSLAARSVQASMLVGHPGPVHLNLPFREPLVGQVVDMPKPRDKKWSTKIESLSVDSDVIREVTSRISGKQGVIIAGRGASRDVLILAEALGWPVLADPRSGVRECHPLVVIGFDSILRSERFVHAVSPDVVLRIGETPASKVLAQWVNNSNAEVVQIRAWHNVSDPDHHVALTAVGDVNQIVLGAASQVQRCQESWLPYWSRAEVAAQSVLTDWTQQHMSEPTVARTVTDHLEVGSYLVVSSSMPIRDVEWFGTVTPGVEVLSNRGTNGIDGVVSTAVGVALATGATVTLLIGDIACIHDSNGLWGLMNRDVDVRIVVTNNDGGSIFSFLPQASIVSHEVFETLYGTPHGVSFSHLAAAHGVPHTSVDTAADLIAAMSQKGPRLIEVPLDRSVNVDQHNDVNEAVVKAVDATV